MQSVWARRLKETFAILTVGDGIIEVIFPTEHSLLWEFGPARVRKVARFFAENPSLMRLLGAAQVVFGIWLAKRQYHGR
jgi:hypothetical protein